ncbi:MAG: response regulator transcription factor [Pseudomonadota bacterium]|nr:response regulator transcription factor [Pseudomonadota bacterium]
MTSPLRMVIVDDEPLAVERLQMMVARIQDVAVVGTASNGQAALRLTEALRPDVVLLDIAMPGMDGIDVARSLGGLPSPPKVVFVTAFESFAVAAFDVQAVDYLMKPIDPARLERAIERVRNSSLEVSANSRPPRYLEEFWVSDFAGLSRVQANNVDRIVAERDYMRIHVGKRSWLINHSLTKLEQELDPECFVRLHRGAIVRRSFIVGFRNEEGRWVAQLADGSEQRIGRAYAENARNLSARGRFGR